MADPGEALREAIERVQRLERGPKAPRYTSKADRETLWKRQNGRCCGLPGRPCGVKFSKRVPCRIDHIKPVSPECRGTDTIENKQLLCEECHIVKTRGTGATTAGTDMGNIRKLRTRRKQAEADVDRILAVVEFFAGPELTITGDGERHLSQPRSRWPKGRKLQSRPFPKGKRKLRGQTNGGQTRNL